MYSNERSWIEIEVTQSTLASKIQHDKFYDQWRNQSIGRARSLLEQVDIEVVR